jgi:phosphodiesterase/alkaline phosphatase D-like protein
MRVMLPIAVAAASAVSWFQGAPAITHGVASGDVTTDAAVIWSRADRAATMRARVMPAAGGPTVRDVSAPAAVASDFTAQALVTGLVPATSYRYEIWFETTAGRSTSEAGTFRTAPSAGARTSLSFIWGGDLGGQRHCRRVDGGYRIFEPMLAFAPDFFIANGDLIYADNDCPAEGPEPGWTNVPGGFPAVSDPSVDWTDRARLAEVYAAHWKYNRADASVQAFLRAVPMYAQWDDHEVKNDFGAPWPADPSAPARAGYPTLVAAGRQAFFDYHPLARHTAEPDRIYRSYRWGRDVELFILDARSYRSANQQDDVAENAKTLLGREQLAWLTDGMARSTATWKIVSSDVPLSVPTGSEAAGRDAFANESRSAAAARTGFERELLDLMRALDAADVRNVVFVTTDVHFAAQIRYERDFDGDGDTLLVHELISGPLSAVRSSSVSALDPTLGPVLLYGEGGLFNFGAVRVGDGTSAEPRLWTDIRDERGRVRPGSSLELRPEPPPAPASGESIDPALTEVWEPVPPVVTPGATVVIRGGITPAGVNTIDVVKVAAPPSDAVVLFDGTSLDAWQHEDGTPASWRVGDGAVTVVSGSGNIETRQGFGDVQLHLEWQAPAVVAGEGQERGNSGVFLQKRYEVQVLDSFDNRTYANGQAASIYKQSVPLVNASHRPGMWQTYDIVFTAPRFAPDGTLLQPAFVTVIHNGVLVQNHVELAGRTVFTGQPSYEPHAATEPIMLQDHGNPVRYRNIWVRELRVR